MNSFYSLLAFVEYLPASFVNSQWCVCVRVHVLVGDGGSRGKYDNTQSMLRPEAQSESRQPICLAGSVTYSVI